MKRLSMRTREQLEANVAKLAELFPGVVTETADEQGVVRRGVDWELLRLELEHDAANDAGKERYQLTWPGKKQAIAAGHAPIDKTLRPMPEESVDWDTTENLYLEGDNLDVLKLLQESYVNKVKCIYIDPPYNTGNDFVYRDDFRMEAGAYWSQSGERDELGNRLVANPAANGRYHSDWLSMMYPRIKLARTLLRDDGVMFVSIDDHELDNLKKVCDELFGPANFVTAIPWQSRQSIQNDTDLSISHEYILMYAKVRRQENRRLKESNYATWFKEPSFACYPLPLDESRFDNPDKDPRGKWKADPFDAPHVRTNLTYAIVNPNTGEEFWPPQGRHWRTEESNFKRLLADGRIVFGKSGESRPQLKVFYNEKRMFGSVANTWFDGERYGTATEGTKEQQKLFGGVSYFDTPKPTRLIRSLLALCTMPSGGDIVLDFFSGSATTADAVMQLNAADGGNRRFVLVQLPEPVPEGSEASRAGYRTICDIGKERVRRVAQRLQETAADAEVKAGEADATDSAREAAGKAAAAGEAATAAAAGSGEALSSGHTGAPTPVRTFDGGFRVFRLDTSNMKDVFYSPDQLGQADLLELVSNIKDDRTSLDLLAQVMLELGMQLSLPMETVHVEGNDIHLVGDRLLAACFDPQLPQAAIRTIATMKPQFAVFRDACFHGDSNRLNAEELFKSLSPSTELRVL